MEYLKQKKLENYNEFEKNKEVWVKEGNFENFNISQKTIDNLKKNGFEYLFPIQQKTFKSIKEGKDVIGKDRTGSGKTLAFSLPIIEKLRLNNVFLDKDNKLPKIMVIVPTRELCLQVTKEIEKLKNYDNEFNVISIYGGTSIDNQIYKIKRGIDIIVGTPGRVIDLQKREVIKSRSVQSVILDETDQMLDQGFKDDIESIISNIRRDTKVKLQFILFSATLPRWIYDIAKKYLDKEYLTFDLVRSTENKTSKTVEHLALFCPSFDQKINSICDILSVYGGAHSKTIIFTETKKEANEILSKSKLKVKTHALHGDIPQKQREITFEAFRKGEVKCLVATNIAARGLDIPEIDLILQLSPPKDIESYIHRSGRTARAGKTGVCVTYYNRRQKEILDRIEYQAKIKFKQIGFPQPQDIIKASADDLKISMKNVSETISNNFLGIAKNLIEEFGAEHALSKAIVLISGHNEKVKQRSLLCSMEGFKTYIIKLTYKIEKLGYFWGILKKRFSGSLIDSIKGIKFLIGREGCIFDIENKYSEEIDKFIAQKSNDDLEIFSPNELPDIEDSGNNGNYTRNDSSGYRRNDSNGYRRNDSNGYRRNDNNGYRNDNNGYRNDNNGYRNGNNNNKYNNDDKSGSKLFISNISYKLNDNEIVDFFQQSGINLKNMYIPKDEDNNIKGYGFGYVSSDKLDNALKLNGTNLKGRSIGVQLSKNNN